MADWIRKNEVEIFEVFQKLGYCIETYLIKLKIPEENSIFSNYHEVYIQGSNFFEELVELKEGKRDRCCFAYGMQDIDFYKINDGRFAITHSPHEGLNIQMILSKGQIEEILRCNVNSYNRNSKISPRF